MTCSSVLVLHPHPLAVVPARDGVCYWVVMIILLLLIPVLLILLQLRRLSVAEHQNQRQRQCQCLLIRFGRLRLFSIPTRILIPILIPLRLRLGMQVYGKMYPRLHGLSGRVVNLQTRD